MALLSFLLFVVVIGWLIMLACGILGLALGFGSSLGLGLIVAVLVALLK